VRKNGALCPLMEVQRDYNHLMKAISLYQPWAFLAVSGAKTLELRSWTTHYRGRLLIHASKTVNEDACRAALCKCRQLGLDPELLARGALLGTAELAVVLWIDAREFEARRGSAY